MRAGMRIITLRIFLQSANIAASILQNTPLARGNEKDSGMFIGPLAHRTRGVLAGMMALLVLCGYGNPVARADGLEGPAEQPQAQVQEGLPPGLEREFGGILFCWIPPGSFLMGRHPGDRSLSESEVPLHEVTFAQGFWLSKYPITQAQWRAVMGTNPSYFRGNRRPVETVSWNAIRQEGGVLDQLAAAHPGHHFRLPSEAEWEYAYRAGTTTRYFWGEDPRDTEIDDYAWHGGNNPPAGTQDVGGKRPNAWGLHDMAGNVWEWCEDDWHWDYSGAPADGSAWLQPRRTAWRVIRGGSWYYEAEYCRAANRNYSFPDNAFNIIGFRIVRTPADQD